MTPVGLFRRVALAEAMTWALLLLGMFLKYVTDTTDLAVSIFGPVHGVVFIAYCLTAVVVGIDQRWSPRRTLLALAASIPPFTSVAFDVYAERRGALSSTWRLVDGAPAGGVDRPVAWLLRHPLRGAVTALVAVGVLTGVALAVGPPVGG